MITKTKMRILFSSAFLICIVATLLLSRLDDEDELTRIMHEINSTGHSKLSEASPIMAKADSAKMENNRLILHEVEVLLEPGNYTYMARSVSIRYDNNPGRCLKIMFHNPTNLPRWMEGRSCYISLEESFFRRLLIKIQARMKILNTRIRTSG
jgi:hypothetical protein